jgi:hypothetical protein
MANGRPVLGRGRRPATRVGTRHRVARDGAREARVRGVRLGVGGRWRASRVPPFPWFIVAHKLSSLSFMSLALSTTVWNKSFMPSDLSRNATQRASTTMSMVS